ncbi:hypothetical protein Aduo_012826 [Ancylostoma duodenale]
MFNPDVPTLYASCKLLGNRIEKFSGDSDKTFEEFSDEFKDLIDSLNIPHHHARSLLPLYLTGGAKLKYQSLTDDEKSTWESIVTTLAKKFKNQAMLSNIRDELHNMRQGKDSVGEFAKKILAKTKIAFQGEDKTVPNKLAIDFFIKGLRSDIRKAIRRLPDPPDFETAVANAEKEQRILEQEQREERQILEGINALVLDDKVEDLQKQVNSLQQRNKQPPPRITRPNRFPQRAPNPPRFERRPIPNYRPNYRSNYRGSFPSNRGTLGNQFRNFLNPRNLRNFFRPYYQKYNPFAQPYQQQPYLNPNYPQPALTQGPPNVPPQQQQYNPPARFPNAAQNVNFLCIITMITAFCMIPVLAQEYQICGSSPFPNTLSLPQLVQCSVAAEEPIIKTKVGLYVENNKPLQMTAHKCYRDLIKVSVHNFLYIRTRHTVVDRQRISISPEECRSATVTKSIHGHTLTEVNPGLFTTNEIEDENARLPLWGTNLYLRSVYSIEKGEIASFNGESLLGTLGNLENCSLPIGNCQTPRETIVWEPLQITPWCRFSLVGTYDALVTMNYILLQEHELIFELSQDHLSRSTLLQHCDIYNGYPTTSNHIISFPNAPPNLHIQDFILEESPVIRKKRGAQYITDTDNRSSRYDLVPYQTLPLAQRLYSITAFEGLPPCQTQPIKDPKLLREIKQWNVTNHDFLRRSQLYEAEDPCLSVLRTIRYCEYRFRQLAWLHSIRSKRPLNYAEHAIQQDLEHGVTDIFDDYLSREFGPLRIEILRDQNQLKSRIVPFFQEEDIKSEREETTAKLPLPKTTVLPLTEFTTTTPKTTETSLTTMKTPITTKSRPTTTPKPCQITSITSHNAASTTRVKSNPVYSETRRPSPVPEVKTTSTQRPPFTTPIITTQTTVKPTSVTAHFKTTVTILQTTTRVAPTTKRVHKANPFDYSLHQISQTSKPAIQASSSEPKYYHEVPLTKITSEPSSHDYIQHQTTTINKPSPQVHSFKTNYRQVVPTSEPVRLASSLESQIPQDTPITSTSIPGQYMKPSPTNPHLKLHGITKIFRRRIQ